MLAYHETDELPIADPKHPRQSLRLIAVEATLYVQRDLSDAPTRFGLRLTHTAGQKWKLCAGAADEHERWLAALQPFCQSAQEGAAPSGTSSATGCFPRRSRTTARARSRRCRCCAAAPTRARPAAAPTRPRSRAGPTRCPSRPRSRAPPARAAAAARARAPAAARARRRRLPWPGRRPAREHACLLGFVNGCVFVLPRVRWAAAAACVGALNLAIVAALARRRPLVGAWRAVERVAAAATAARRRRRGGGGDAAGGAGGAGGAAALKRRRRRRKRRARRRGRAHRRRRYRGLAEAADDFIGHRHRSPWVVVEPARHPIFDIRQLGYKQTKQKAPSDTCMYECVGVDLFATACAEAWAQRFPRGAARAASPDVPSLIVVNAQRRRWRARPAP